MNCLKIGRKSSGVMVTGGEDRRVNLFAIGKPGAILSMTGHQSPVECVTFDRDEEVVVAGAAGGTLKLWDLESAKVVRTLVGHRSNCTSVDFHPFGEFFASGSLDTNLKIWDVRRKGCIHTYKGHDRGVGVCKFSPDGKWVVSGGQDGRVRLWDLTAGKLLKQLHVHDGPVTSIEFHPNELLLATGSADRTVKFWDLEMFGMVDECVESTGVKSMLFHPDGRNLLTGTSEFLKVWGWEPSISRDAVDVSWRNLQDLSTRENKLLYVPDFPNPNPVLPKLVTVVHTSRYTRLTLFVHNHRGASIQNSFVGVWVVDLNQCAPFSGAARGPGGGGTRDADREHRHGQTPEEAAAAAVAAAAELSKARVLRLEREAGTVRDGVTTADDKEPSTSNATDGFSGRPFDPRDVKADKEDREEGNRSPMAMNLKFAAAHGIGEDPMETTGQPPPAIVYAKPKPAPFSPVIPRRERKRDERRPGGETSSCPETRVVVPEVNEEIPEEVYEDDFVGVGAEDSLENVDEEDDDEMTRALGLGSDCIRKQSEPTPRYSQSPTKPLSATKKHTPFQSPTRASPRKSYKRDTQEEAFNLETLRSAALEADTEFIDANGGGGGDALLDSDSVSIETLAVAMARARAERARDEDAPSTAATQRSSFEHVHQTTKTPTPTKASALLRAKSPLGVDFASFVPGAFEINGTPPTPTPDEHVVLHALSGEDSEIVLDIYHSRLNALKGTYLHFPNPTSLFSDCPE